MSGNVIFFARRHKNNKESLIISGNHGISQEIWNPWYLLPLNSERKIHIFLIQKSQHFAKKVNIFQWVNILHMRPMRSNKICFCKKNHPHEPNEIKRNQCVLIRKIVHMGQRLKPPVLAPKSSCDFSLRQKRKCEFRIRGSWSQITEHKCESRFWLQV